MAPKLAPVPFSSFWAILLPFWVPMDNSIGTIQNEGTSNQAYGFTNLQIRPKVIRIEVVGLPILPNQEKFHFY